MNDINHILKASIQDLRNYWYFIPLLYIGETVFLYGVLQQTTGNLGTVNALSVSLGSGIGFLLAFLFIVGDPGFDRSVKTNTVVSLRLAGYSIVIGAVVTGVKYGIGSGSLMATPSFHSTTFAADLVYQTFAQPAVWTLWFLLFVTFPGYFWIAQGTGLQEGIRESIRFSFWQPKQVSVTLIGSFILTIGITALFSLFSLVAGFRTVPVADHIVPLALPIVLLGPAAGGVLGLRFAHQYLTSTSEAEHI